MWKYIKPQNYTLIIENKMFECGCYVTKLCLTLCDPMNCSMPGLPVHNQLPEFTQTHVHWAGNAIQPSRLLSSPSLPAFNLSQHQGLFKWVSSTHQVAKVLKFQLQHQSLQWILRTDFLRMDWLDSQGTLKSLLQNHSSKASILQCSAFFIVLLSHPYITTLDHLVNIWLNRPLLAK